MYNLEGKVAIVTGAARLRGIGRGCALALAGAGADVVVTGTSRSPGTFPEDEKKAGWQGLPSVVDEIKAMGRRALGLTSDATNPQDVQAIVQATVDSFGHIDILINNAASPRGKDRAPVYEVAEEEFLKVLLTNLMSTVVCTKYVSRQMIEQGRGGKIVNMSSISGKRAGRAVAAYDVSKFGIIGFTQSAALDLAPFKINVNAICPGATDTMRLDDWGLKEAREWEVSHEEAKKRIAAETVPLGRLGTVEDIANMAIFLSSSCSDFVTGQSINLCGGRVFY